MITETQILPAYTIHEEKLRFTKNTDRKGSAPSINDTGERTAAAFRTTKNSDKEINLDDKRKDLVYAYHIQKMIDKYITLRISCRAFNHEIQNAQLQIQEQNQTKKTDMTVDKNNIDKIATSWINFYYLHQEQKKTYHLMLQEEYICFYSQNENIYFNLCIKLKNNISNIYDNEGNTEIFNIAHNMIEGKDLNVVPFLSQQINKKITFLNTKWKKSEINFQISFNIETQNLELTFTHNKYLINIIFKPDD